MAHNLAIYFHENSLPPLILWNRTASKLPPQSESIQHAASVKDLCKECDIVLTSLANDEAALAIFSQLFEGAKEKVKGQNQVDGSFAHGNGTIFVRSFLLLIYQH